MRGLPPRSPWSGERGGKPRISQPPWALGPRHLRLRSGGRHRRRSPANRDLWRGHRDGRGPPGLRLDQLHAGDFLMIRRIAAVLLALHGVIHLIGFVVPWRIATLEGFVYR